MEQEGAHKVERTRQDIPTSVAAARVTDPGKSPDFPAAEFKRFRGRQRVDCCETSNG